MKTIDVLVEELPKRGGWPDGAIGAGFLSGEGALYFWDKNNNCPPKWTIDTDIEVEDSDEEITREQYESALAASKRCDHKWVPSEGRTQSGYLCSKCGNYDGPGYDWIDWPGGECPVPTGTLVDVKWRDGRIDDGIPAKISHDLDSSKRNAISWRHHGNSHDIIAYRLHQPKEAEQAKADDEDDLNEFIGQDAAPVWSGEGQPPVGCECEFMKHTLDAMPNWRRGIIKYVSEYTVVIVEALSPGEFVAHPRTCDFRPLRTKAERKRDDICDKIYGAMTNAKRKDNRSDMAEEIYDAIAAGKIPGLRLED